MEQRGNGTSWKGMKMEVQNRDGNGDRNEVPKWQTWEDSENLAEPVKHGARDGGEEGRVCNICVVSMAEYAMGLGAQE